MKEEYNHSAVGLSGMVEEAKFSIDVNGKAFKVLVAGLYADKPQSIMRELCANAYDSHCEAGRRERPFKITIPTAFDPIFAVRDYGTSLTHEAVFNLYTTLFRSTKDQDNNAVGKFGLGSKVPFAYTDAFDVTTWLDGTQRVYNLYYGEDGIPRCALFAEMETEEENGLEVRFPVNPKDVGDFRVAAGKVLRGFEITPEVGNAKLLEDIKDWQESIVFRTKNVEIRKAARYNTEIYFKQGCILYPLDRSLISTSKLPSYLNYVIDVPIGTLQITPSRESLSYDDETKDNIARILTETAVELGEALVKSIEAPTKFEQWSNYRKIEGNLSSLIDVLPEHKWMKEFVYDTSKKINAYLTGAIGIPKSLRANLKIAALLDDDANRYEIDDDEDGVVPSVENDKSIVAAQDVFYSLSGLPADMGGAIFESYLSNNSPRPRFLFISKSAKTPYKELLPRAVTHLSNLDTREPRDKLKETITDANSFIIARGVTPHVMKRMIALLGRPEKPPFQIIDLDEVQDKGLLVDVNLTHTLIPIGATTKRPFRGLPNVRFHQQTFVASMPPNYKFIMATRDKSYVTFAGEPLAALRHHHTCSSEGWARMAYDAGLLSNKRTKVIYAAAKKEVIERMKVDMPGDVHTLEEVVEAYCTAKMPNPATALADIAVISLLQERWCYRHKSSSQAKRVAFPLSLLERDSEAPKGYKVHDWSKHLTMVAQEHIAEFVNSIAAYHGEVITSLEFLRKNVASGHNNRVYKQTLDAKTSGKKLKKIKPSKFFTMLGCDLKTDVEKAPLYKRAAALTKKIARRSPLAVSVMSANASDLSWTHSIPLYREDLINEINKVFPTPANRMLPPPEPKTEEEDANYPVKLRAKPASLASLFPPLSV